MARKLLRWLGGAAAVASIAAPAAWAGMPVVGVDVGAAIPISKFRDTADPGGAVAPFIGYQWGDSFAITPLIQPQLTAFHTDTVSGVDPEDDITTIFAITAGARMSLNDENKEVFVSAQGGYYSDITGPINDKGDGFNIAAGFNYEFHPGTALGLFIRRDQSSMRAARGSTDDLTYLVTGLSFRHRFLPPPPAPPPPPPVVAQAPPPPPAPMKKKLVLRGVNFDFDKSDIRADARPILDEAAATLKDAGAVAVVVDGHTDARGTDEYNQALSLRRANSVRSYLIGKGIDASRMTVEGFGESRPVASNDTDEGRAQNRRVELRVSGE